MSDATKKPQENNRPPPDPIISPEFRWVVYDATGDAARFTGQVAGAAARGTATAGVSLYRTVRAPGGRFWLSMLWRLAAIPVLVLLFSTFNAEGLRNSFDYAAT